MMRMFATNQLAQGVQWIGVDGDASAKSVGK
jgi:hypothetical protein